MLLLVVGGIIGFFLTLVRKLGLDRSEYRGGVEILDLDGICFNRLILEEKVEKGILEEGFWRVKVGTEISIVK